MDEIADATGEMRDGEKRSGPVAGIGYVEGNRLKNEQLATDGSVWRAWWECRWCNGEIGAHDKFCKHCGKKLDE